MKSTSIMMICLGNICRSPLAEVIMQKLVSERGLDVHVESCGTGGYHAGQGAHPGSVDVARTHGLDLSRHEAKQFESSVDFERFDWHVCMDTSNRNGIRHQDRDGRYEDRIVLLLDHSTGDGPRDVPDPYYGGGFENVYQLIEDGCAGFLDMLEARER
jgi:protein-tyrosine phosphatase